MKSKHKNRLSMYLSFKDFQAPYTAITNPLPNYTINSTLFLNTIAQIQLIAEQQKTSKKEFSEPGTNPVASEKATRQLGNFFRIADTALANMDAAVEIVRLAHIDFYIRYKNARKVISKSAGSLAVRGLVIDSISNKPIKGVKLSFSAENYNGLIKGTATDSVVKKTAEKGGFNIKSLPSGMYTVVAKKEGYLDQVATVAIAEGELTELNFLLSKD